MPSPDYVEFSFNPDADPRTIKRELQNISLSLGGISADLADESNFDGPRKKIAFLRKVEGALRNYSNYATQALNLGTIPEDVADFAFRTSESLNQTRAIYVALKNRTHEAPQDQPEAGNSVDRLAAMLAQALNPGSGRGVSREPGSQPARQAGDPDRDTGNNQTEREPQRQETGLSPEQLGTLFLPIKVRLYSQRFFNRDASIKDFLQGEITTYLKRGANIEETAALSPKAAEAIAKLVNAFDQPVSDLSDRLTSTTADIKQTQGIDAASRPVVNLVLSLIDRVRDWLPTYLIKEGEARTRHLTSIAEIRAANVDAGRPEDEGVRGVDDFQVAFSFEEFNEERTQYQESKVARYTSAFAEFLQDDSETFIRSNPEFGDIVRSLQRERQMPKKAAFVFRKSEDYQKPAGKELRLVNKRKNYQRFKAELQIRDPAAFARFTSTFQIIDAEVDGYAKELDELRAKATSLQPTEARELDSYGIGAQAEDIWDSTFRVMIDKGATSRDPIHQAMYSEIVMETTEDQFSWLTIKGYELNGIKNTDLDPDFEPMSPEEAQREVDRIKDTADAFMRMIYRWAYADGTNDMKKFLTKSAGVLDNYFDYMDAQEKDGAVTRATREWFFSGLLNGGKESESARLTSYYDLDIAAMRREDGELVSDMGIASQIVMAMVAEGQRSSSRGNYAKKVPDLDQILENAMSLGRISTVINRVSIAGVRNVGREVVELQNGQALAPNQEEMKVISVDQAAPTLLGNYNIRETLAQYTPAVQRMIKETARTAFTLNSLGEILSIFWQFYDNTAEKVSRAIEENGEIKGKPGPHQLLREVVVLLYYANRGKLADKMPLLSVFNLEKLLEHSGLTGGKGGVGKKQYEQNLASEDAYDEFEFPHHWRDFNIKDFRMVVESVLSLIPTIAHFNNETPYEDELRPDERLSSSARDHRSTGVALGELVEFYKRGRADFEALAAAPDKDKPDMAAEVWSKISTQYSIVVAEIHRDDKSAKGKKENGDEVIRKNVYKPTIDFLDALTMLHFIDMMDMVVEPVLRLRAGDKLVRDGRVVVRMEERIPGKYITEERLFNPSKGLSNHNRIEAAEQVIDEFADQAGIRFDESSGEWVALANTGFLNSGSFAKEAICRLLNKTWRPRIQQYYLLSDNNTRAEDEKTRKSGYWKRIIRKAPRHLPPEYRVKDADGNFTSRIRLKPNGEPERDYAVYFAKLRDEEPTSLRPKPKPKAK